MHDPYPHARILRVDTSKALKIPGVKAIVPGEDAKDCYIGKQIRDNRAELNRLTGSEWVVHIQ